jgi:MoxR-like ATPase
MNSVNISLKQLFDFLQKKYSYKLNINEMQTLTKNTFFIKNEVNKLVEITDAIKKLDTVISLTSEIGTFRCAAKHILPVNLSNTFASFVKVGDELSSSKGLVTITEISNSPIVEEMFDLSVNSETHLYQTADGIIHHNTSSLRQFAKLIGVRMVTIEAPHITEEHIINIPFIVFDPITDAEKKLHTALEVEDEQNFKVVLSDSYLFSQIKSSKAISDAELFKIVEADENLKEIWEDLGGAAKKMPKQVEFARKNFKVLLFIDEFFRQPSPRIANMLRDILNGQLGIHTLPKDCYVIFASNMEDEGLAEHAGNADFLFKELSTPSKDEWFKWLINKFKKDQKVTLKQSVVEKFYKVLEEEDLNVKELAKDIRVSPRRWEQVLLYINAGIPVESEKDAKALLTNVKINFTSHSSGETAAITKKVLDAVAELIKETTPEFSVSSNDANDDADWKDTLAHQIKSKMKIGAARSYVPVISGAPGVGKTSEVAKVARDLDLIEVRIDCSTLDPEDVLGLPVSKGKKNVSTTFSEPKLYKIIMSKIEKLEAEHIKGLAKAEADKFKKAEYKYLLFFDELSRVKSVKVFNAIRQVLLEKKFSDEYPLPEGTVILAAKNPKDVGVTDMTSHMKDVIDDIQTAPAWSKTEKYLKGQVTTEHLENKATAEIAYSTLTAFVDKFKVKQGYSAEQRPYHLDIGANDMYISPREYTTLYSTVMELLDAKLVRLSKQNLTDLDADELAAIDKSLRNTLYNAFEQTLASIFSKHGSKNPAFLHDLKTWFLTSNEIDIADSILFDKVKVAGLKSILDQYVANPKLPLEEDADFVSYIQATDTHKFKEDFYEFLEGQLQKEEDILDKVINTKHSGRKYNSKSETIEDAKEKVSDLEHIIVQVYNTIKIHKLSNDRIEHLIEVLKDSFRGVMKKMPTAGNSGKYDSEIHTLMAKLVKMIKSNI